MAAIISNTQSATSIISTAAISGTATQVYTLMCWFKINSTTPIGSYRDLVCIENNIYMQIISNTTQIDYGTFNNDHLAQVVVPGVWYHSAMIVVPTSTTSRHIVGYLNGQQQVNLTDTDTFAASDLISIGNSENIPTGDAHYQNPLDGFIEDVRIWTRELTLREIIDEMGSIVPVHKQALLVWAPLNDNLIEDKSGHGNIFTAGSGVTLGAGRPNRTWLGRGMNYIK